MPSKDEPWFEELMPAFNALKGRFCCFIDIIAASLREIDEEQVKVLEKPLQELKISTSAEADHKVEK